ncbi:hypothetical protein [Halostagnicola bangensis]
MAERPTVDRRTVLQTIGSSTIAGGALASSAGATDDAPSDSNASESRATGADCDDIPSVTEAAANPPESYVSTVDRVVDGEHVVILLEDGTQTVGQIVVPSSEYPCLEERDRIVATVEDDDLTCYRWLEQQTSDRLSELLD